MGNLSLQNKPLIEALFEVRWELQTRPANMDKTIRVDPHYKLLVGSLYSKMKEEYPFHMPLPASTLPDEIAAYVVQHRFRKEENGWPLFQLGPGILSLNDSVQYTWEDFSERINTIVNELKNVYPSEVSNLRVSSLLLRYINSSHIDNENILKFLQEKMKIEIKMNPKFFQDKSVEKNPSNFDVQFSYSLVGLDGDIHLRFIYNKIMNDLRWEIFISSNFEAKDFASSEIVEWAEMAHSIVEDWFLKIIDGELMEEYK